MKNDKPLANRISALFRKRKPDQPYKPRKPRLLQLYRDIPIRRKLLLISCGLILIPIIFIGYMSYMSSENIIKKKSTEYSQDILRLIEFRLNDSLKNMTDISQDLIAEKTVYNVLNYYDGTEDPLQNYQEDSEINAVMHRVIRARLEIQSICFVSLNNNYFSADNGIGIQADELLKINERLAMSNDQYFQQLQTDPTTSVGLENVNRRIKLFYGELFGLAIESEWGQFTKVRVTIPPEVKN
jgi:hypothetical protein